jgi:hypothetical protein
MAITHTPAARNLIADFIVGLLDIGVIGNVTGESVIRTGALVEVARNQYSNPAFLAATGGIATADTIADDTNADGGIAAIVTNEDRANTEIWRGTVTAPAGGGDMEISDINVNLGDTVQQGPVTYQAPD